MFKFLRAVLFLLLALVVGLAGWLYVAPPDTIRVGAGYTAKIVCSNVFIAGRDADQVLEVDVQAAGHPILGLMRISVDRDVGAVRAGLFGIFGNGLALYRQGAGCATIPDGDLDTARAAPAPPPGIPATRIGGMWPTGNEVETSDDTELNAILNDETLTGPGMRAVVVIKDGVLVAERYGDGFDETTPLLGWSMTKTVTSAIIGRLVRDGVISRDDQGLFDAWSPDGRGGITLADMLGMASDLEWNEGYGYVSDVTRMLYLEPDMAAFAAAKPFDEQSPGGIGEVFNYSSGTSVMLSRIWQDRMGTPDSAMAYPGQALFGPLRMLSAVLETDARGTIVGSSYLYATARDWARFGQFLLQRGVWEGRSLLPVGYVDWMSEPHPASEGVYGRGHLWTRPPQSWLETDMSGVPDDAYFLSGHDGQMIAVVPSSGLVVVRLGLTPSTLGHRRIPLVQALLETLDN